MRISDWSSDVCSSDLPTSFFIQWPARGIGSPRRLARLASAEALAPSSMALVVIGVDQMRSKSSRRLRVVIDYAALSNSAVLSADMARSVEHTSELQSLMRISYAVFCLKKKKI